MRFSFTFAVSVAAVAAVSAGVYPAKTGVSVHATKGGSDGGISERPQDGDRFHLQSPDGQYVFGHTTGNQGRAEMRAKDGTVTGYYSYAGGDGRVVYVNYVADKNGYRVLQSNAGVPSSLASVTVEKTADDDFQRVFLDFTERIKNKLVGPAGQKVMDPIGEGQRQVPVDQTLYPVKETKPSKPKERNEFPAWDQVKISTTRKPTNGMKHDEGQQQQEIATDDPNWGSVKITTQKSNVPSKGRYSDVVFPENRIQKISTEIANTTIGKEPAAIDDTENISPATKPASIASDVQTTVSYSDNEPRQTAKSNSRGDFQSPEEADVSTTMRPLDHEPLAENSPTTAAGNPSARTDFQVQITSESSESIDFTTIAATVDERVQTSASPAIQSVTTNQSDGSSLGEHTETATASIEYVTEQIHQAEFRTLEPTERLGTTIDPNYGQSEAQVEEIAWPEIPSLEPAVPQVLVPLDPCSKEERLPHTKKSGVKTHPTDLRPARHNVLDRVDESTVAAVAAANVTETETTTVTTPAYSNREKNSNSFNFPLFYITG